MVNNSVRTLSAEEQDEQTRQFWRWHTATFFNRILLISVMIAAFAGIVYATGTPSLDRQTGIGIFVGSTLVGLYTFYLYVSYMGSNSKRTLMDCITGRSA